MKTWISKGVKYIEYKGVVYVQISFILEKLAECQRILNK